MEVEEGTKVFEGWGEGEDWLIRGGFPGLRILEGVG